ncbi:hypothetical protein EXIGLDRAFT_841252 [Exidia glandulosa HHB12029]|uniref:Uncharacterized protein n=1 Tax=Exidia glandulosa HHB12029 TaxID=1314781 RepID=A0A165DZA9_EXIGL|nr:hypothetical protein EXIGLDRAFT_841252 [Exidia glandulosa HHB12029]
MSLEDASSLAPNVTAQQLWSERACLDGVLIGAVAYGVHATLFFIALKLLWERSRPNPNAKFWMAYIIVVFAVSSVANGAQLKFTQMSFVDNRNYPGGPSVYIAQQAGAKPSVTSISAYIINGWLQDALIIYRFWVIYNRSIPAIIGPVVVFLGEIVVSFWLMIGLSMEGKVLRAGISVQLFTSYFSLSIALNILLTLAIVTKLLLVRRRIRHHAADSKRMAQYVSVSAMMVESAALYAVCGILFLVPWGLKNTVEQLVLPTLGQAESLAPLLIIVRVAQGRAWSSDTESRLNGSTIRFGTAPRTATIGLGSVGSTLGTSTVQFKPYGLAHDDAEMGVIIVDREVHQAAL